MQGGTCTTNQGYEDRNGDVALNSGRRCRAKGRYSRFRDESDELGDFCRNYGTSREIQGFCTVKRDEKTDPGTCLLIILILEGFRLAADGIPDQSLQISR